MNDVAIIHFIILVFVLYPLVEKYILSVFAENLHALHETHHGFLSVSNEDLLTIQRYVLIKKFINRKSERCPWMIASENLVNLYSSKNLSLLVRFLKNP